MTALLAACLVAGAVTIVWPARRRLVERPSRDRSALRLLVGKLAAQSPRRMVLASIVAVAVVALLAGGPVAAVVGAVYAALGGRALLRRANARRAAADRSAALDDLAALAADLRAGLVAAPPGSLSRIAATGGPVWYSAAPAGSFPRIGAPAGLVGHSAAPAGSVSLIAERTGAVWRLAERTGAPAADLVERIEADARTADRAAASATAQAAGAQATALLLAGLPIGGIGLGLAIGADPVRVLLHTPVGAACAIAAVLLQGAGLLWADRLAAGVAR